MRTVASSPSSHTLLSPQPEQSMYKRQKFGLGIYIGRQRKNPVSVYSLLQQNDITSDCSMHLFYKGCIL